MPATVDYFSLLHCFPFLFTISQPIILTYATEVMVFACPQPLIVPTRLMGAAVPTHPTGGQATIIACMKVPVLRPISTDTW
jgi:hypothetical protein